MYAFKTLLFAFALYLSLVVAHPIIRVHRRSPCKDIDPSPSDQSLVAKPASSVHSSSTVKSSAVPSSSGSSVPSQSSSSSSPSSTSASSGADTGSLKALFPVSQSKSWTTCPKSDSKLALSDATFRPNHVLNALKHSYINAPDGTPSMQAFYPKGSYNFGHDPQGGFSFYAPGPASVDLSTAKEATFGYSIFFAEGFKWVLGGKLPGLYGGDSDAQAIGCSGGSRSDACFSARLMWREDGAGEFYTYTPPMTEAKYAANKVQCSVPPKSDCNSVYGASVGRGAFHFKAGGWTTISERVRLNDVGQANGEIELFVNGNSVINVDGLILRARDEGRIRGIQAQTFFGGSQTQFKAVEDSYTYFSDFSVAITETL